MDAHRPVIMGTRHAIATGHYFASQAGFDILNSGGNAIDAGVSAGLAIGVLQSEFVNIAGIAPIMIRLAGSATVLTIDGVGVWPKGVRPEQFIEGNNQHIPEGIQRTLTPGAPGSWLYALERYGTLRFGDVVAAAIRFARDGFPMYPQMSRNITSDEESLRRWESSVAVYLPKGRPPQVGELFKQPDLAKTLRYMADEAEARDGEGREAGIRAAYDAFYKGDIAKTITDYHRENGGFLTMEDLAAHRPREEPPIRVPFRGLDVYGFGPNASGPVLTQALMLADGFDLEGMGHNSPAYIHTVAESMKLAFADRDRHCGDPAFVDVPLEGLYDKAYLEGRRALIDSGKAWPELPPAGNPRTGAPILEGGHRFAPSLNPDPPHGDTSAVCVVDEAGNAFVATPSDIPRDTPVIPGTGVCPSSRGSQSWAVEGHAACLAPGKRSRLSSNPMMALKDGEPYMVWATPGSDVQPQATLQVLLNHVVFGMDIQEAIEAPRFATYSFPGSFEPHDYYPGRLNLEARIPKETGEALAALGHKIEWWPDWIFRAGGVCGVQVDPETGLRSAGGDPRRPSYALGW